MAWEYHSWYRIRSPRTLLSLLAYGLTDLPWLSMERMEAQLEGPGSGEALEHLARIRLKSRERGKDHSIMGRPRYYWEAAVQIPRRRGYLLVPLTSIPDVQGYDGIMPRSGLDWTAPNLLVPKALRKMLAEIGLENHLYIVFLDGLFFPGLMPPESGAHPENLSGYFECHSVSRTAYEITPVIEEMRRSIARKKHAGRSLTELEEALDGDPEFENEFRRQLVLSRRVNRTFHTLQLREFFSHQLDSDSRVYAYGIKSDFEPFGLVRELYNEHDGELRDTLDPEILGIAPEEKRTFYLSPYEGRTSAQSRGKTAKEGGITSKSPSKAMSRLIENTW